jgi:hypothetical protein
MSPLPSDDEPSPFGDGEYAVLKVPDVWHVVSLLLFAASMGSRFLVSLFPRELIHPYARPILAAYAVPFLAAIGLLCAVAGLSRPESRSMARIAAFLNGVVLVLGLAALAVFRAILP